MTLQFDETTGIATSESKRYKVTLIEEVRDDGYYLPENNHSYYMPRDDVVNLDAFEKEGIFWDKEKRNL